MTPFELAEPKTLNEAHRAARSPTIRSVRPIAGGTALMLMMKAGVFRPTKLVSLRTIKALTSIDDRRTASCRIGAMTPLAVLEHSAAVRKHAPVITRTLRTLSNVRVRNVATVGGSSRACRPAHGPAAGADRARRAASWSQGQSGERTIPVEDLFAGYYETVLAATS